MGHSVSYWVENCKHCGGSHNALGAPCLESVYMEQRCKICEDGELEARPGAIYAVCDYHMNNIHSFGENGVRVKISAVCDSIKEMLLAKNESYGNSALEPLRIFSKADPKEQLRCRIDDKLSRFMRGNDFGEDNLRDLIGYLILLYVAEGEPKQSFVDEVAAKTLERS